MILATALQLHKALARIRAAESDLGKLSPGMRRDLLKDNFPWDGAVCDAAADRITLSDGGSEAVTAACYAPGGFCHGEPRP